MSPTDRNAPGPVPVRRLRTGADINQPTIFAEIVENDPMLESSRYAIESAFLGCSGLTRARSRRFRRLDIHIDFARSSIGTVSRSLRDFTMFCTVVLYFIK